MVENPDARIGISNLPENLFGFILGLFDSADTLPVAERLLHHRIQRFPNVRLDVAAWHDDGKKRFHLAILFEQSMVFL